MTIQEALDQVDDLKPNTYSDTVKIRWLNQLDGRIYRELVCTHEGSEDVAAPDYANAARTTQLIAQEPYEQIYVHWLECRIDYYNSELQKFNNTYAVFAADFKEYDSWYNRTHMPLGAQLKYF